MSSDALAEFLVSEMDPDEEIGGSPVTDEWHFRYDNNQTPGGIIVSHPEGGEATVILNTKSNDELNARWFEVITDFNEHHPEWREAME